MTPLQNDPQQHQRGAKGRKCRIPCGGKRSPDSESACRELSKSGLASHVGPHTCSLTSNSGGGTTAGGTKVDPGPAKAPKWTRVRPRHNQLCLIHMKTQQSGLGSYLGPQTCDFTSNSGGGTTTGAPKHTRVRPGRIQCATEELSRTPYR